MLAERTVTIVGLGSVGAGIAKRLSAFDMRRIGIRHDPSKGGEHVEAVYGPERLPETLAESDYVVLALPITPATEGMFGREELAALKPGALLVNVARGNVVDEGALADAMDRGRSRATRATSGGPTPRHFPRPITSRRPAAPVCTCVRPSSRRATRPTTPRTCASVTSSSAPTRCASSSRGAGPALQVDLERGY
jgi:hypothetical protein